MKNGRFQAKDISDSLVLNLYDLMSEVPEQHHPDDHSAKKLYVHLRNQWHIETGLPEPPRVLPVGHVLKHWFPYKVVAVKLAKMEKRGQINTFGFGPLYGQIQRRTSE